MTSVTSSYAPQNPDEQLKVGMRMIELAFEEKARVLEQEVRGLREYSQERQSQLTLMERRAGELEGQLREAEQRQRDLAAENASLNAEKSQLSHELKNAQRELQRLDSFKRSILQSIKDDGDLPPRAAFGGASNPSSPPPSAASCGGGCSRLPLTDYASSAAPTAWSAAGAGAGAGGGATPASAAAGGGDEATSAHLDGKDFFRQARLRLTYEQFNMFLSNIKRLNDHAQTREDTLMRAQDIFGADNDDLFQAFKSLLSRHGLT